MKYELQRSFSSGELSELTHMRNDYGDVYDSGLSILKNMRPDSRGPAVSRDGLKFTYRLGGPPQPTNARLEALQKDNEFNILMFIHIGLILIRDINNPLTELLSAPWTMDQIDDLYFVPLPDGRTIYVFHPNVQTQKIIDIGGITSQNFSSSDTFLVPAGVTELSYCICGGGGGGHTGFTNLGGFAGGGAGVKKGNIVVTPGETITITIGVGGAGGDGFITANGADGADSQIIALSGTITSLGAKGGSLATTGGGLGSESGGNGGGVISPPANGPGGLTTATCDGSTKSGGSVGAGGSLGGSGGGAGGFGDGGNGGVADNPSNNAPPNSGSGAGGNGAYVTLPQQAGNGSDGYCTFTWLPVGATMTITPVTFTSKPVTWLGTNWPSCGTYYQGRLWMGGVPDNPEEFYGSVPDLPEDLTLGTPPAGAIKESIEQVGGIKWMGFNKNLLIGTSTGEHIVTSDNKILIPGGISIDQQSSYGSFATAPLKIGDQVLYVSTDRRRIYAMNYEFLKENWLSTDLTFYSEHITSGLIRELAWSQYPNKEIYAILEDGTFTSLSYDRSSDTFGWCSHNTQGKVISVTSGFDGIKDVTVIALERVEGEGDISVEFFHTEYKLDAWEETSNYVVYGDIFYITMSTNNLADRIVQILIDGVTHQERVVGAESALGAADGQPGRIYLDFVGSNHVVGLQYIPQLVSIPKIVENQDGNDFMHEKTYSEIAVKLLNSRRPIINGMDTFERFPETPQGEPEPEKTELLIIGNDGWDQDALIDVSQPLPYKLTIAAIGGQYTAKKL